MVAAPLPTIKGAAHSFEVKSPRPEWTPAHPVVLYSGCGAWGERGVVYYYQRGAGSELLVVFN